MITLECQGSRTLKDKAGGRVQNIWKENAGSQTFLPLGFSPLPAWTVNIGGKRMESKKKNNWQVSVLCGYNVCAFFLFFFFLHPLKGNTRIRVLIVLVRLLAEAYRLVFVHSRAKGILLCVCGVHLHVREVSSAVEDGPVPVRPVGEHRAFGVGLPPVRTQSCDGLVGKQKTRDAGDLETTPPHKIFFFSWLFRFPPNLAKTKPASSRKTFLTFLMVVQSSRMSRSGNM